MLVECWVLPGKRSHTQVTHPCSVYIYKWVSRVYATQMMNNQDKNLGKFGRIGKMAKIEKL